MSASIYLLARAYPAVLLIPMLNIPIVNGFAVRIGTTMLEKLCFDLPIYAWKMVKKPFTSPYQGEEPVCLCLSRDDDFPDFVNVDLL